MLGCVLMTGMRLKGQDIIQNQKFHSNDPIEGRTRNEESIRRTEVLKKVSHDVQRGR